VEPVLRRLANPLLTERHGPDLTPKANFAEGDRVSRNRLITQARQGGQDHRQVRRRLADPNSADNVDEYVLIVHCDAGVPM
jgi:hypothetical protein